jgi:tight adherence protein C
MLFVLAGVVTLGGLLYALVRRLTVANMVRERTFDDADRLARVEAEELNPLARWLMLAGFRSRTAPSMFLTATAAGLFIGLFLVYLFYTIGAADQVAAMVGAIPGGVGDTFAPLFYASPWVLASILAMLPWLIVRRARFQRVAYYEQDLPLTLDLLSTLSESGLGFDTGLTRILETRLRERPLAAEFRRFQADMLAGRSRVHALRRLAKRIEVPSMSIFVSALVQAEQMGSGLAGVLRRQADDLRDRRRERANAFAMSLPVKRLVPMVVCFLPGIFVWAIGPVMIQLLQLFDRVIQQVQS